MWNRKKSATNRDDQSDHEVPYNLYPFEGWDRTKMDEEVDLFIEKSGLNNYRSEIRKGAYLAQDPEAYLPVEQNPLDLTDLEVSALQREKNSSDLRLLFHQPWRLYALVACCSLGAAVQGWDESAVNGAQLWYPSDLGIGSSTQVNFAQANHNNRTAIGIINVQIADDHTPLMGLINSAPYLCCILSCWFTGPLNRLAGRKGTIAITCLISAATCLGQAFAQNWTQLFVCRLLLGLGIGPKSATIPIYAAESAPAKIRGALVMQWQMWTAFGIMCWFLFGVAFEDTALTWRLMLGSPMVVPFILFFLVFSLPESPRWLLQKAQRQARRGQVAESQKSYANAFIFSLYPLRETPLQAARDLFLINYFLEAESRWPTKNRYKDLWNLLRCRRALFASLITMFLQQMCGVNVLAYYSGQEFARSLDDPTSPRVFLESAGFGMINFFFALPAVWIIDSFGRRSLLLITFPLMALFQLLVGCSFLIKGNAEPALVVTFTYLFAAVYSVGEGPVPFLYSAESLPLYNRDQGMGIITSVNWAFNFLLAMTWPSMSAEGGLGDTGGFCFYAAWCLIGFFMILLFVPETKKYTLEQLDTVFNKSTKDCMRHGIEEAKWFIRYYLRGQHYREKPEFIQVRHSDITDVVFRPIPLQDMRHIEAGQQ